MAQNKWEPDKTLDQYIHDYFVKRNLHESAKAFVTEANVSTKPPVAIDAPGGFLYEWWSIFSDAYIARNHGKHSDPMAVYSEAQQIKAREHQQHIQMQQRGVQLQRRNPNIPSLGSPMSAMNSEGMPGQPSANALAMKLYEESMKISQSMDSVTSNSTINAKNMAHLNPLPQGNTVSINAAFQKMQFGNQQTNDTEGNPSGTQRPSPIDPSSVCSQVMRSSSGLSVAGLNQGIANLPLKGWPLTNQMQGNDQLQSHSGAQLQRTNNVHNQTQFILAQSQARGSHGNSTNYVDTDPNRFGCLPSGGSSAKDGQPTMYDRSLCSPIQSSSTKMNIEHAHKSSSQQQDHPQQQSQQNNNKRKRQSSSGPANSTGTGNTAGPSPRSPPSTHGFGDGAAMILNNQHANLPKDTKMNDREGTPSLLPSYGHLDDINNLEDVASLDDNIELFLIDEGGDGKDSDNTIKQSTTELKKDTSTGFSFAEVRCIRAENTKFTCCHFSSDGNILASAGHDKKVVLWNMETLQTESPTEFHQSVITDIRFRPNTSQLATASMDNSVRLWDAANPSSCLRSYTSHSSPIMSLDFHPNKTDLFCFCDNENEIHYWTTAPFSCTRVSKGATTQVRFQPQNGQYLAAASDKLISIFDIETNRKMFTFQGHCNVVKAVCWDPNGEYLASVSEDVVNIWSLVSGECIHEFGSNGNQFHSCTFHPSYSTVMVVGGISSIELWNIAYNKNMTLAAHENVISALGQSPVTGFVASASYDGSVKLWK